MLLANPWGLLALISLPAIVAIHLFRLRFRRREVSALFLWSPERPRDLAGRKREPPRVTPSLILELLAAAALSLLIADPRLPRGDLQRHAVLVLDASASMSARDAAGRSAIEKGRERARRILQATGRNGRATLILTGARPRVLAGPGVATHEALARLEEWKGRNISHSSDAALALARRLAGDTGEITLITDTLPAEPPRDVTVLAFGESVPNAGFVAAHRARARDGASERLFLCIRNFGPDPITVNLSLHAGGRAIASREVPVPAQDRVMIEQTLPLGLGDVRCALGEDALLEDNVVTLCEAPVREVIVANLLPEGVARTRVETALNALTGVRSAPASNAAHMVIAPVNSPEAMEGAIVGIRIGPVPGAEAQAKAFVGPFTLEHRHALLEGLTLAGVIWGGVMPVAETGTPILTAGELPLILALPAARDYRVLLNVDLARSNLHRSPDWPVFWSNAVELTRAEMPGLPRGNYRPGELVQFRLSPEDARRALSLRSDGAERPLRPVGEGVVIEPEAGARLCEVTADGKLLARFSVNFLDETESDLAALTTGESPAGQEAALQSADASSPLIAMALAGLAAALLFADWWLLERMKAGG